MNEFRESRTAEWKEKISRTCLKTVSAFANYGTGEIYFGITDDGQRAGLADPAQAAMDLENQINDNLAPVPDFRILIEKDNVVFLEVFKGADVPYCYKNKAYKRSDTATVEVSLQEFRNLILKGQNISWTEVPCQKENLTFQTLSVLFENRFNIPMEFPNTFITLELYSEEEGYTNAALLSSEQNSLPGIDLVVYGFDESEIQERIIIDQRSVFDQIKTAEDKFLQIYQYEKVVGMERVVLERIPFEAFRELLVYAVVHREWQVDARIRVEFYKDGIRVTSPGGLPDGVNEQSYVSDEHISILRNKTLDRLFLKLKFIENLGSGLPNIRKLYRDSIRKPEFTILENSVSAFLPVQSNAETLDDEERIIYSVIKARQPVSVSGLETESEMSKATVYRILGQLQEKQLISRVGKGRATRYKVKD